MINIGIIGSGFIVPVFIQSSKKCKAYHLRAIWGRHEAKLLNFKDEFDYYTTDLEEILNDEFVEKEITQTKSRKKIKIAISIIASMLIIATTTLLIGHFKFHWFENEIYTIDVNISRNVYQAEHFTETKTIKTKIGFSNGESDERTNLIKTNFMVIETDKKQTEKGFLNTAFLIK